MSPILALIVLSAAAVAMPFAARSLANRLTRSLPGIARDPQSPEA